MCLDTPQKETLQHHRDTPALGSLGRESGRGQVRSGDGSLQCLIPSEPICVSGLPDVLRQRLLILVVWYEKVVYFSFV